MSDLEVRNLFHRYGAVSVLERVNLHLADGAFAAIVGASGCGKSTFLRLVLGQETPSHGEIRVGGTLAAPEPGPDRGVVFQRYSVFPHLSVEANLIAAESFRRPLVPWIMGSARRAARDRAAETLKRIGLAGMGRRYPAQLSGGQQQRLALAQALAARPRVLLLDEPFGALDPDTRLRMHDVLRAMRSETPMTVLMVSHDLAEAFALADRVLVFDKVRRDPQAPEAFGATITREFDASDGVAPTHSLEELAHGPA